MTPHDLIAPLNNEQRAIACTLDRPLFVSAGAGSGKTFTLTRRIAWALSPGSGPDGQPFLDSLDQVLVITFTEAAAREILERVRQTLREAGRDDPRMREAALSVDRAWISTIHGMCSRILHRHALDLGIDPEFVVADAGPQNLLSYAAMDEVMERARNNPSYQPLFEGHGVGGYSTSMGYTGAMGLVSQALALGSRCPAGLAGLAVMDESSACASLEQTLSELGVAAERLAAAPLTAKGKEALAPLIQALHTLEALEAVERTPERIFAELDGLKIPRSTKATAEEHAELVAALAQARLESALVAGLPAVRLALTLAQEVAEVFARLEREEATLTNDDLIDLALSAVRSHPEIARDYTGRFRLVMVDEFQDTDERQLELISLLAGEGASALCTVGDAQQSIYRFRGADVGVFREQGRRLPAESHVQLATNYRSHTDILALVERVCGGHPVGEGAVQATRTAAQGSASSDGMLSSLPPLQGGVLADYMHLDPSTTRRDGYVAGLPRVSLEVVTGPGSSGSMSAAQSCVMAGRIAERLAELAAGGVEAGQMALLLGVTTHADLYIDAMRARGLECVVTGGSTFTSSSEAAVMCALLHTLANPIDTESGLFRLLASEVFELDADDFVLLGTGLHPTTGRYIKRPIDQGLATLELPGAQLPSARLRVAHEVLLSALADVGSLPVADICLRVVRDSGWLARLEAGGAEGLARAANVLAAVRYIRDLTSELGLGPARAAAEFDRWLALAKVPPATLSGGVADTVRVMTIHASKGLEFPVVAVAECWRNASAPSGLIAGPLPSRADLQGAWPVILTPPGASALLNKVQVDTTPARKGSSPSLCDDYIALRTSLMEADQAEKARLLYVALTRAEEALVVGIGCPVSKQGPSCDLAAGMLRALAEPGESWDALLVPGACEVDFGGQALAQVQVTRVEQKRGAKGEPSVVVIDTGGGCPSLDGEHVGVDPRVFLSSPAATGYDPAGAVGGGDGSVAGGAVRTVTLFEHEAEPVAALSGWRAREGVFSYSSAHRVLEAEGALPKGMGGDSKSAAGGVVPVASTRVPDQAFAAPQLRSSVVEHVAEMAGAPAPAEDADKATNLGSAFHELAQMMVETGRELNNEQVMRMAHYWHLSERATGRLKQALARWAASDLRAEAQTYDLLRAEVPFFVPADSDLTRFGEYVEGAIDLLCTNAGPGGTPASQVLLIDYKTGDRGLLPEQIRERHAMQADFYARVLRAQGFTEISCAFVCVELDSGELAGGAPTGQPHVVRYDYSS